MMGASSPVSRQAASAVVLAGGKSSRLGQDKAFLPIDGQPLIARIVVTLSQLSNDLVVVTNDPEPYQALSLPARLVPDERPGEGALMGLYSGLSAVRSDHAVAVGCDMPFLSLALLRYMLSLAPGHDVVIPRLTGLFEPLHAVYARTCLPLMAHALNQGRQKIISFFPQARVRPVEEREIDRFDPRHLSFMNVNTPEDWQRVQSLLRT